MLVYNRPTVSTVEMAHSTTATETTVGPSVSGSSKLGIVPFGGVPAGTRQRSTGGAPVSCLGYSMVVRGGKRRPEHEADLAGQATNRLGSTAVDRILEILRGGMQSSWGK